MLVGNDDKFIGALVVVNVEALQQAGIITKEKVGAAPLGLPRVSNCGDGFSTHITLCENRNGVLAFTISTELCHAFS
jgi:hypothetical protein